MTLKDLKKFVPKELLESIDDAQLENLTHSISAIEKLTRLNKFEICNMLVACPKLLKSNSVDVVNNLSELSQLFSVNSFEFKSLLMKNPNLLFDYKVFKYNIELIATTLGVTMKEALKYLYLFPDLERLTKESLIAQINMLTKNLHVYGLTLRNLLKQQPRLLFTTKSQIDFVKRYFMRSFGLTEEEVEHIFKAVPSLVFSTEKELANKFSIYYPNYFIKRDIKEMLVSAPELVTLDADDVVNKIEKIAKYFEIKLKKACEFVRNVPNILFYPDPIKKLNFFAQLGVTKEYILTFPQLCEVPETSLPIKFILVRLLKLEQDFDEVANQPLNTFMSKFLFMQKNEFYNHRDLLLDGYEFEEKYQVSIESIQKIYSADTRNIFSILKHYYKNQSVLPYWREIPFPAIEDLVEYINCANLPNKLREQKLKTRKKQESLYATRKVLGLLKLTPNEADMVLTKKPQLKSLTKNEIEGVSSELIKFGFTQDEIVKLLILKPSLFMFTAIDFVNIIAEITQTESCTEKEAVLKYM